MVAELASTQLVQKPWGSRDLRPWIDAPEDGPPIGELWFHRSDKFAAVPALLLKLIFTEQPLSIQVHPGDAFARSIGLLNGKSEAWYILSSGPDAEVAIGLKTSISALEFRAAIADRSIVGMVNWKPVRAGDVFDIPAGTIHAIGADIVLAEVQQRSDATFRIFDYERDRELHVESAIAVADTGPGGIQAPPKQLSEGRAALVVNQHFVLEKINLPPASRWLMNANRETWLVTLEGGARVGQLRATKGSAIFVEAECIDIEVGPDGLEGLLAYACPTPDIGLLTMRTDAAIKFTCSAPSAPTQALGMRGWKADWRPKRDVN